MPSTSLIALGSVNLEGNGFADVLRLSGNNTFKASAGVFVSIVNKSFSSKFGIFKALFLMSKNSSIISFISFSTSLEIQDLIAEIWSGSWYSGSLDNISVASGVFLLLVLLNSISSGINT